MGRKVQSGHFIPFFLFNVLSCSTIGCFVKKKRLDQILVDRLLAPSRQKAKGLILAGDILVQDVPHTKCGSLFLDDIAIRVRNTRSHYVSRSAVKLIAALDCFKVPVKGRTAMDIGASTGGFTQALLERGIIKVIALDVGTNQLHWSLRSDPRVQVYEKTNARYLKFEDFGEKTDIIVVDVSFISLTMVLRALLAFSKSETDWITLIKPQFEIGKNRVGKGGIVRSSEDHQEVIKKIQYFSKSIGLKQVNLMASPIKGTEGNCEFLAHWRQI